jgi:tetratricopeptide (TPR) repeat protein
LFPAEVIAGMEAAAANALALDDRQAEAHHALAVVRMLSGDYSEADRESRRTVELDPSLAEPRVLLLLATGRTDEALAIAEHAYQLDPQSVYAAVLRARALGAAGHAEAAIAELTRTTAIQPIRANVWFQLGARYVKSGQISAGIPALEKSVSLSTQRNPRFRAYLGYAYAAAGRTGEAEQILSDLVSLRRQQYVSSFSIALIHEGLGQAPEALAALERAVDEHAVDFTHLDIYPAFDTLRSEPRFERLMRRVLPRSIGP